MIPTKTKQLIPLIFLLIVVPLILTGCTREGKVIDNSNNTNMTVEKLNADEYCKNQPKSGQKSCPEKGEEIAVIETNYGTIKIKFFDKQATKTTKNFKKLTKENFYDSLIFHRIMSGFMIQGGDPSGDGTGGPGYTTPAEIDKNLVHTAGAVATARLSDAANPLKASSGSQFYIVHNDTGARSLDGEYTIFAQVISGMNVVEAIAEVETDAMDKPDTDVIIKKITIEKY